MGRGEVGFDIPPYEDDKPEVEKEESTTTDRLDDIKTELALPAPDRCLNVEDVRWLVAEVERLREERDVYEPAAKNWPAMLKRCEKAEADLAALRQRHADIRALLNPVSHDETIEGAIRNLQQALLSEHGNVSALEQRLTNLITHAPVRQLLRNDSCRDWWRCDACHIEVIHDGDDAPIPFPHRKTCPFFASDAAKRLKEREGAIPMSDIPRRCRLDQNSRAGGTSHTGASVCQGTPPGSRPRRRKDWAMDDRQEEEGETMTNERGMTRAQRIAEAIYQHRFGQTPPTHSSWMREISVLIEKKLLEDDPKGA